jgi:hypothetical protein
MLKSEFITSEGIAPTQGTGMSMLQGTIGTKIGFRKWILALDCDSPEARSQAQEDLESRTTGYVTFESSPGHYWIIVDYVGSLKKCLWKMGTIPGVDPQYKTYCKNMKGIFLRSWTKAGVTPFRLGSSVYSSRRRKVDDWCRLFYDWFEQPTILWIEQQQRAKLLTQSTLASVQVQEQNIKSEEVVVNEKPQPRFRLLRIEMG